MKLACLALDDEPLALALLVDFIRKTPFLKLVAECDSAVEALSVLHREKVDVIFSDIQMSDLTGLELARVISGMDPDRKPLLVFTTAYDQYALQGYKVDAIDYLLKPFSYEDFLKAASKARRILSSRPTASASGVSREEFILFKVEYQHVKVFYGDIRYIEGLKDYVKVHLENESKPLLSLTTLKNLEDRLPEDRFMRIHRSYIVNLDKVSAISRNALTLGDAELPVSDNYREAVRAYFEHGMS